VTITPAVSLRLAWLTPALSCCLALLAAPAAVVAQDARHVLLVVNEQSPASQEIADYYRARRGVPDDQVVRLSLEPADLVTREAFDAGIQAPIAAWLSRHSAQDRILFIVLTKGVPLRIQGTIGRQGTTASVDSELALLYRRMSGVPVPPDGPVANPFFLGARDLGEAQPFSHRDHDIYLVTRLDGFTVADVKALIDRSLEARNEGRILLDMKAALEDQGNRWLEETAARLATLELGDRVVLDRTSTRLTGERGVLGHFSWGSADPAVSDRRMDLGFVPGAIAASFVSTDARTFTEPPASWTVGAWEQPQSFYAGSPQSLVGDTIRAGATGVAGQVAEPYLDGVVRPQILFPAYLQGFTLAEAFYLAIPRLSWQTVVVGDPLARIAARLPAPAEDLAPALDADTELPAFFSKRLLGNALRPGTVAEALQAFVRADVRRLRGDEAGERQALEQAVERDPRYVPPALRLALLYEGAGDHEAAARRLRAILDVDPYNVIALNNLAYHMLEREKRPLDALPLAERAYTVSQGSAAIADTLGWVHFRLGHIQRAAGYIAQAVKGAPGHPEIRYHAAEVALALGRRDLAEKELEAALSLDPAFGERADVAALREKLRRR
jgi:uncharacterized protein (TIGR03790 family)